MQYPPPPLTNEQVLLKQRVLLLIPDVKEIFNFTSGGIPYKTVYEILYHFMDVDPELVNPTDLATMLESFIKIHRGY